MVILKLEDLKNSKILDESDDWYLFPSTPTKCIPSSKTNVRSPSEYTIEQVSSINTRA